MKTNKIIRFSNENEEVLHFKNKPIKIDEKYKYIHKNPFYKFWSWFTHRLIATPFAFITFKLIKRVSFHNTKVLKHFKGGYFIYANHTNQFCDGFCPALICFPKKTYIIVNPANISIPFVGKLNKMWGAIPLPDNIGATKNFYNSIEHIITNNPIIIYPEAHLWPYYTKIRNFPDSSFRYPIKFNKPTFTLTTVYKQRKHSKKPKIEIYVDGPFFANPELPQKVAQQVLRNTVYNKLTERSKLSDCEFIKYIKKEKTND